MICCSTSCILCLPIAGLHLPLALFGIFGIDACDLSIDPLANQSHRLIHSNPSCHLFQTLIILGQLMSDEIDGNPLQEGRVTPLTGSLVVMTTLPKQFLVKCLIKGNRTPQEVIEKETTHPCSN